jgi:hypothetical protein
MSNLFSQPKVKPDQSAVNAQLRQQALADSQLTEAFQIGLTRDSRDAMRIFGLQPAGFSNGYGGGYGGGGTGGGGGDGGWGGGGNFGGGKLR